MNVSSMLKRVVSKMVKWTRVAEARPPAREPVKGRALPTAAAAWRKGDGFESKPAAPVSRASDADFVNGLYRQLLGREPDAAGFAAHMKGLETGMTRDQVQEVFLTSPEFASKQTAGTREESNFPPAGAPGKLGPVPLEGYDTTKLNDFSHTTVKYQFGRVATNYPLASVKDHASAEALLRSMVPDLEAAGIKVLDVRGDKLKVQTEIGHEWVDVVRGAGSGNPGYWWGSEGTAIPGTEGMAGPKMVTPLRPMGPTEPTEPTGPTRPTPTRPTGALVEPGAPLRTVPLRPEYLEANIDKSSPEAAALSAARWVRAKYAPLFDRAEDRNVSAEIMSHVIGALRVAGYDATRVVNHPNMPDGARWGSDALVLNGIIFDVYRAMGEASEPVAQNMGPYAAGRLRE